MLASKGYNLRIIGSIEKIETKINKTNSYSKTERKLFGRNTDDLSP